MSARSPYTRRSIGQMFRDHKRGRNHEAERIRNELFLAKCGGWEKLLEKMPLITKP